MATQFKQYLFTKGSKTESTCNFTSLFCFEYHLNKLPEKQVQKNENNPYFFPNNLLQVSYGTSAMDFGANRFFGMSLKVGNFESFGIPIFWVGAVKAKHSFSLTYQRLLFRTEKIFSIDCGMSITAFQTEAGKENVLAFSIFPTMRFYLMRRKRFDMYTNYSLIDPTLLTSGNLDNLKTRPKITYQDTMGFGFFFRKERSYNAEFRIMHYSNGNIFPQNSKVAVPVQFTFGKTF